MQKGIYYKTRGYHYYLTDLCYACNWLAIVFFEFLPKNDIAFKTAFFFSNGILAMATYQFRNQLVFHNFDYLSSLSIHLFPMIAFWNLRWFTFDHEKSLPEDQRRFLELDTSFDANKFFLYPLIFYAGWVFVYFAINFVICKSNIEKNGYENLYVGSFKSLRLSQNLVKKYGNWCSYLTFIGFHFLGVVIFHMTAFLCFYSYIWHTILLVFYLFIAIRNAANYYMGYFSKNNEKRLLKLALADPTSVEKAKKRKGKK